MNKNPQFRSRHKPVNYICLSAALIFLSSQSLGQTNPFTFGMISEIRSVTHPISLLKGDFNGDRMDDLAAYSATRIRLYHQLNDSLGFSTRALSPAVPVSFCAAAKFNGDDMTDLVCIGGKPLRMLVYLMKKRYDPFLILNREIPGAYDKLITADINSDEKMDIILYGKKELGILVFRGKGNGTFRSPQTIFNVDSFSDLFVEDVNNDGINDIIGLQWIDNNVTLFTGYTGFTFSEPARITLRSEPAFIRCGYINDDDNTDFLVYYPNENECGTFMGDGLGNFTPHQTLRISRELRGAAISDVNGDRLPDVLLLGAADGDLEIHLQNENGFLTDIIPYHTVKNPVDLELFNYSRTERKNIAILDSANSVIRIMYNSRIGAVKGGVREYGLGSAPSGVKAIDLNNDGWQDIIASNRGSGTFSVFLNDKTGHYPGQWAVPAGFVPASAYPAGNQSIPWLIFSTEAGSASLHLTEIDPVHYTCNQTKIIIQDIPDIKGVSAGSAKNEKSVLSMGHDPETDQVHLTEIKWQNGGRVSETMLDFGLPGKLTAVSSVSNYRSGLRNIWCITFAAQTEHVYYLVADSVWNVIESQLHHTIQCDSPVSRLIWSADINKDNRPDCVIFREDSVSGLYVYIGGDRSMPESPAMHVIEGVRILSARDLKITDIDKNGSRDIVLNDRIRRSLDAYMGNGSGRFSAPVNLAGTARWGGFDISDVDNDGYPEVIMTDSIKSTLNILPLRGR